MALVKLQAIAGQGGNYVVTAGINSVATYVKSYPGCTVTVYLAGTVTPATIYSDSSATPKANPFTASSSDASWTFYIAPGNYDIRFSGTGVASPFTLGDVVAVAMTTPTTEYSSVDYASLNAAVVAIGSTPAVLAIKSANFPTGASCTVPSTLTLKFEGASSILFTTGHTVIFRSDTHTWPIRKIFYNATAGQGTVSFSGNTLIKEAYPQWWGAVGDGSTNNYSTYLAAGIASITASVPLKVVAGTYKINDLLVYSGALKLLGVGEASVLDFSSVSAIGGTLITIQGSVSGTSTTLSADEAQEQTILSVVSSAGFNIDDQIQIISDEAFSPTDSNYKKGELATIAGVGAGTITIVSGLKDSYATGPEIVTITKLNVIVNPQVHNIKILGGGTTKNQHAIDVFYSMNGRFSDVYIEDCEDTGISLAYSYEPTIENCHAKNMLGTTNGVGYAFALDLLTQNGTVKGCTTENVSSSFSTGGHLPSWNNVVSGNRFQEGTSNRAMIQTHANGAGLIVANNILTKGFVGITVEGPRNIISGNIISSMSSYGISAGGDSGEGLEITNNSIKAFRGISVGPFVGTSSSMVITNNNLTGTPTTNVAVGISCGARATIAENRVHNHSPGILLVDGSYSRIEHNEIVDTRNDSQPYGIYLSTTSSATGIRLINNVVRSQISTETTYDVLIAAGITDTVVEGNTFKDILGAYISDNGTRTIMKQNVFDGRRQSKSLVVGTAGLTNATLAGKVKTVNNIIYELGGLIIAFNATDNFWTPSASANTGVGEFRKIVFGLDNSGAAVVIYGQTAGTQAGALLPNWDAYNVCPIGYLEIPASYTAGAALTGAGFTYRDFPAGKIE